MTIAAESHACTMRGDGPADADVMCIGIAPEKDEALRTHKPFTGPSGKLLDGTLAAVGYSREKTYCTNLICWWKDAPTAEEIDVCWPELQQEIQQVNPKIIVCLGKIVSDRLLGEKKWKRGHLYWRNERWILPTYHPAAFLRKSEAFKLDIADFARDLSKLTIYPEKPYDVNFVVAESEEEASAILWSLHGFCYIDIEASYDGLPFAYPDRNLVGNSDSKLLCFSVTNDRGTWVIPGEFISGIRRGWGSRENVKWGMHLGLYDKAQLRRLLGEELQLAEDSLLMSYSLDERGGKNQENDRAVGIHGLKGLSAEFLGADDYDVNVLKADAKTLHEYNAKDTFYGYKLVELFKPKQEADNVREMYERILIPGANVLSEIQAYGVAIDKGELFRQGAKWTEKWVELNEQLLQEARDYGWRDAEDINLGSWQQLQKFLFKICFFDPHPEWGRSTRKEVIEWLAPQFPWCEKLLEWRGVDHIIGSYIAGVEDDLKYDGRIHPQPVQHGTRSGRLAYHKPPIQTIPKHGVDPELAEVRRFFVAGENRVLIEADLKQAELWACGYLSGDDVLLNELSHGDAHAITAIETFEITTEHELFKSYREIGKLFNFGTLYNRTADGYARNPFQGRKPPKGLENYKLTKAEAQRIINRQMARWPKVDAWKRQQIKTALTMGEQVTHNGRKRRYWLPDFKTVNQSINLGPQTLAHDYLFDSLTKLHWALAEYDAHVLYEIHDALIIDCPKPYIDEVVSLVKRIMTEPKFGLGGIPCDISIGENWLDMEAVK